MSVAKLSDFISRGCEVIPKQARSQYLGRITKSKVPDSACAMFTACFWHQPVRAMKLRHEPYLLYDELSGFLKKHHGTGLYDTAVCPVTGDVTPIAPLVEFLNDTAKWPREKIAAWLRQRGL